jgi:hypothetical protein
MRKRNKHQQCNNFTHNYRVEKRLRRKGDLKPQGFRRFVFVFGVEICFGFTDESAGDRLVFGDCLMGFVDRR